MDPMGNDTVHSESANLRLQSLEAVHQSSG